MELMLRFINVLSLSAYSDAQNKIIADYLAGKTPLEQVPPFLTQTRYGADTSTVHEIGRRLAKEKELLPAFGRFVRVLKVVLSGGFFLYYMKEFARFGPSLETLYVSGGLGAWALLVDVLNSMGNRYGGIEPEILGYESYAAFFAGVYQKYPEQLERLTSEKTGAAAYAMFARMYLYSCDRRKYGEFAGSILACGASIIGMHAAYDFRAFAAVKNEPALKKNPHIKTLETLVKQSESDLRTLSDDDKAFAALMFYLPYVVAAERNELFDLINYIFVYHAPARAFHGFGHALGAFERFIDEDTFHHAKALFEQGLVPKERFLAHFAFAAAEANEARTFTEEFYAIAMEHKAEALAAISLAEDPGAAFLARAFFEQGLHPELLPVLEQRMIDMVFKEVGRKEFAVEWFLGQSEGNPKELPEIKLVNHHRFHRSVALLCKASKVPARMLEYAVAWRDSKWFMLTMALIRQYFDEKTAEDMLDSLANPVEEKAALLMDIHFEVYFDPEHAWVKQASRVAGDDPMVWEHAFKLTCAKARALILEMVYKDHPDYRPEWLMECLGDGSKMVRELAVAYLMPKKELKEQIEPLTQSKKKAIRESAEKLMMAYSGEDGGSSGDFNAEAWCVQHVPKNVAKVIEWTEFESLPKVRRAGSETFADDRVVQGYIYLFVTQTVMAVPLAAANIREALCKEDLREVGRQLYHIWKKNGAVAKQRGALVLAAIDGDDEFVKLLRADLQNWADASRGQLAADAVRAMALQGGNLALMTVDAISKKFNNKQVKRAGEEAFLFAAEQLKLDPEVLADKIVPSLGFDERGQQVVDYGSRQFTATITPSLQIEIKNADGKVMKSLPAPGANDDEEQAKAAKAAFAAMKKSLKSVASIQCLRLEQALSANRTWRKSDWAKLFVENPIMNMFAIGLIWGTYDETGKLLASFRYMEDGTFTDADENEITLAEADAIGLCHPLDLGEALAETWKAQLADYEIAQPVEQLERKVFLLDEKDKDKTVVTAFGGAVMYAVSLLGKLQKLGWYKGSVQDAGGYSSFYKEDKKQNVGVWLNFSGTYVGVEPTEEVTVYDALFYKSGTVQYGSYVYDEVKEADKLKLGDIPARLYSELCYDLARTTAGRIRTDENWESSKE